MAESPPVPYKVSLVIVVRGLRKVTNVVLLAVMASNILQHAATLMG